MIGLTATCQEVPLPLTAWGSGTRRLAALTFAEQKQGESPVTLVDAIERGLAPYPQHAKLLEARWWRRGWDSNPRALSDKTLSRRPRYDHFGTSPM